MKTLTRSPDGGCVTVAVTRHEPSVGSIAAEAIAGFGSDTLARLSHGHTGAASGKSAFGGISAARTTVVATQRAVAGVTRLIRRCRRSMGTSLVIAEVYAI